MLLLLFLFVLIPCKCKVGVLNNTGLEADIFFFPFFFFLFPFFFATRHVAQYEHLFFFFFTPKIKEKEKNPLLLQPHLPSKRSPSSKIATRSFTPLSSRRIRSASCRSSWNKSPLENHHCALQRKRKLADG